MTELNENEKVVFTRFVDHHVEGFQGWGDDVLIASETLSINQVKGYVSDLIKKEVIQWDATDPSGVVYTRILPNGLKLAIRYGLKQKDDAEILSMVEYNYCTQAELDNILAG